LPEISQLEQRMRLEFSECQPVGPDLRLTGGAGGTATAAAV
jgi:hypothetical protein